MANYPKELTDLLQEYLTDSVITPKERQVLLNKAESMNVNPDEFDLYIDAQLQKLQITADVVANKKKGKLCPFCQASLQMFEDRCPECGNNITPEASKEVEELIDVLETALVAFKAIAEKKKANLLSNNVYEYQLKQLKNYSNILTGKKTESDNTNIDYATKKAEVERYIRKAKMYYSNNKAVNFLVSEVEIAVADAEKSIVGAKRKKRNIIIAVVCAAVLIYAILFACIFLFETDDTSDYKDTYDTYDTYDIEDIEDEDYSFDIDGI